MSVTVVGIIGILVLIGLFLIEMPIAFAMAIVGFVGFSYLVSLKAGLAIIASDVFQMFSSYDLTVVTLFVFMGSIAFYSGMSQRLYAAAYSFLGGVRGGLAMATCAACALFGAICGSTTAGAAAMGKVTLPEMKRYEYDTALATGCVAVAGSLAILIPPSTIFIVYGIMTQQSIGKLFISGIIPGIILTIMLMAVVYILCWRNPALAPAGPRTTVKEKLKSFAGIREMAILFLLVIGGLFAGWFTPTEAGAIGAFLAMVLALIRRQLTWQGFLNSIRDTLRISAMIFLIVTGATIFGHFFAVTMIPFALANLVKTLPVSPMVVMICILFLYFIGGCFMDSLAMVTLTIPIFYPAVIALGFDPIWFGVVTVLIVEMGVVTPPVGINVYVIKGVAPEVPLETIFRGILPFLIVLIGNIILLLTFPKLATFLPSLMK
jgi:C4-dicarboxylate transporter DctM subunit